MNKYRDILGRVNYALFVAVVALLPFPQIFLRYACVAWIITWFLELRWLPLSNKKYQISNIKYQISNLKSQPPFLLFGLWFAWNLLSGLWAGDHEAWAWQMERYIAFGALVPVGIWGVNERYNWRLIGKVFVVSCLCAVFFYPAILTLFMHHREIIDNHPFLYRLWDYSHSDWIYFYTNNISHLKHRLFLCAIETMGIVVATKLWYERRWLWASTSSIMAFSILLSGSRQVAISLAVIALIALYWWLSQRFNRRVSAGLMIATVLAAGALLTMHPRIRNMQIQSEIRTRLWETAMQQPQDYFWTGLGCGQDGVYLLSKLPEDNVPPFFDKLGHCHNQYLQELIELGIFGLLLFVLAWIAIPLCAPKEKRRIAILFTVLYLCNMFTDCMFGVFCGIALWAVGMVFIFAPSQPPHSASDREACID